MDTLLVCISLFLQCLHVTMQDGCQNLNSVDLARRMRDIGQYNERYMAATLDEAAREFPDLTDSHFIRAAERPECDATCEEKTENVKRILNGKGQQVDWPRVNAPVTPPPDQSPPQSTLSNNGGRRKRASTGIRLDNVGRSYILYCSPEGYEEKTGYHRLCAGCRSVRELPDTYFPRFLNEVRCSKKKCVKDHGSCVQKYLNFDILRNEGTRECQRWMPYTASVPICCDCMLSSQSMIFLSLVQKE